MFKSTLKCILLFTIVILCVTFIEFTKQTINNFPEYAFNIILLSMLGILWHRTIVFIKSNGGI